MRDLGIISIRDMLDQPPDVGTSSPFALGASISRLRQGNADFGTRTLSLLNSRTMTGVENADAGQDSAAGEDRGDDSAAAAEAADTDTADTDTAGGDTAGGDTAGGDTATDSAEP